MANAKKELHPTTAVGLVLFMASLVALVWAPDWRWPVTGMIVLIAFAGLGSAWPGRPKQ